MADDATLPTPPEDTPTESEPLDDEDEPLLEDDRLEDDQLDGPDAFDDLPPPEVLDRIARMKRDGRLPTFEEFLRMIEDAGEGPGLLPPEPDE